MPTIEDYRWLVSNAAQPWLQRVREETGVVSPALIARLRKDLSAEQAHLVVELVELRQRAREKFSLADQMFFTRKGLEQATDEQLAAYKAARFPELGPIDLCCGIGGDLIALARRGHTVAVDRDPVMVLLADANAMACGLSPPQCVILEGDAATVRQTGGGAWHCDPDRRVEGRRTTQLELFEPPLEVLDQLLIEMPNAAIKLAPATELPLAWFEAAEREWLGSRGECRQQVAWFGSLARHPGRNIATIVAADGSARSIVGSASEQPPVAGQLGRYLYEPHAAILAANVTATLCQLHSLAAVSEGIGYLTADHRLDDPAVAAFEVREVLPFDRKQLRAWCRQHRVGRLEIKKRGVDIDPERVRSEIIATGDNEATIILSPIAGQVKAIVAKRM